MKHHTLLTLFLLLVTLSPLCGQKTTGRIEKSLTIYNDVLRQLDINYADTLNYDDLVETSIQQMLRKVDPYTVYIPEDKTSDLRFMTTGKYGGIGAIIMQRGDTVCISQPYEGMPAQKNDVRAGDKIMTVDGKSAIGRSTSEISALLKGTPKSTVTLRLLREGVDKPIIRSFEREEIKISPIGYATALPNHIGYIAFTEFTENSAKLFQQTVDNLVEQDSITALIIDLRNNGGGIIDEAIHLLSAFLPKGTEVVCTKGRTQSSNRTYKTPLPPQYPDMPLVVIVNEHSASAAEIVAGALQDLDRATLIGTRTYGKGLVQSIRPIAYNGHLKVTTSKYYIPSGRCIQAIDYSKRRSDGSVERVPDSLTHVFYTQKGRPVRDGGGIEPDILINDSSKVDICYSLYTKNLFFDYATRYRRMHDTLPAKPADYIVSDTILADFRNFLNERRFTYETETSKYFADVLEMAKHEDIDSTTLQSLEAMKDSLTANWQDAFDRHKEEIRELLGREIVERYFYQQGVYAYNMRYDKELKRALEEYIKP
ncbi:MAG: S41 family peptidase [Paludibacter sp.]|nr:S41 family peptidase [Bacteroidales bacterium]MCM1069977.1 S41 family peptidase [Prevotella sp.]MCM1354634.1 S41 family peptidase [Bacteroides sp.]MCM1443575.1 S41 family peptidase [Muribaculum sp.]MCM1482491.1 S41 family peptidase [Paludibacter sp.]